MKYLLLCITFLCLLAAGTGPVQASHKKKVRTEATITAVSNNSISVKSGHATHTFKISGQTTIHVDGLKVTAKDLKKGMHAEVTASLIAPGAASAIEASTGT